MVTLSEVRCKASGSMKESRYTIYWSAKESTEKSESGVGLAIKRWQTLKSPCNQWQPNDTQATIVRRPLAHALTMTNPGENTNRLSHRLGNLLASVPKPEKITLMGELNAWVGQAYIIWSKALAPTLSSNTSLPIRTPGYTLGADIGTTATLTIIIMIQTQAGIKLRLQTDNKEPSAQQTGC